jgi:pimeloyl-ACP methyl ester carboxylesterase
MRRRFIAPFLLVGALLVSACGASSAPTVETLNLAVDDTVVVTTTPAPIATTSTVPLPLSPIVWDKCSPSEPKGIKCGVIKVPYSYEDPTIGTFTLSLKVHSAENAKKRIGSLIVNRGGPGAESASMAPDAGFYFSQTILDHFDIVAFDPRGTGASTPFVDCVDEYDSYFASDVTPNTPEEKLALVDDARRFNAECQKKSGDILPYISTISSARDIDMIRRALDEETISFFGFSYGSELGAHWVNLFPNTVRAAVFDGAADPNASFLQGGLDQAAGFEGQLNAFFADCATRETCPIYNKGKPEEVFDKLMVRLERDPLFVSSKRTLVNEGIAYAAAVDAMYSDSLWPTFAEALADATDPKVPDATGLLALYDDYYQRRSDGTYDNLLEAFTAISCIDDQGATSVEEVDSYIPQFTAAAPRLGAYFAAGYNCTLWPVPSLPQVEIANAGNVPIVVIGTTGDAATPLSSSRKMASALGDGRLIVVTGNQHTGYGTGKCVNGLVDTYLVKLEAPKNESTCK